MRRHLLIENSSWPDEWTVTESPAWFDSVIDILAMSRNVESERVDQSMHAKTCVDPATRLSTLISLEIKPRLLYMNWYRTVIYFCYSNPMPSDFASFLRYWANNRSPLEGLVTFWRVLCSRYSLYLLYRCLSYPMCLFGWLDGCGLACDPMQHVRTNLRTK